MDYGAIDLHADVPATGVRFRFLGMTVHTCDEDTAIGMVRVRSPRTLSSRGPLTISPEVTPNAFCQANIRPKVIDSMKNCRPTRNAHRFSFGEIVTNETTGSRRREKSRPTESPRRVGENTGGEVPTQIVVGTPAQSGLPPNRGIPDFSRD
jgi:hypothetical protein